MIKYGSVDIDLNIKNYKNNADILLESTDIKTTGRNKFNKFIKVPNESQIEITEYFNNLLKENYNWNWEYFHSGEPAGLHTDYLSFPNKWESRDDECHVILGVIIPLEWNSRQPYTVSYNRVSPIPRKLVYRQGEMRYIDNNDVFEYRTNWEYDPEVLKYNPKGTDYYKEYADLKIDSVYEWKVGTALLFDTKRWHSSSWFLTDNKLPDISTEYKRSIIGMASINIKKYV